MNQASASNYSPIEDSKRLIRQAERLMKFDEPIIQDIMCKLGAREKPIRILDVGCADGFLTYSRFSNFKNIEVLGVDICEESIAKANTQFKDSRFTFMTCNVEGETLPPGSFDFIFSSYLTPHLKDPQKVLQGLWIKLRSGGAFFIRCGEDGWKVTHPSSYDLEFILDNTMCGERSSDRQAGRKIYQQLGLLRPSPHQTEVRIDNDTTVNMTGAERVEFFDQYYAFRSHYVLKEMEKNKELKTSMKDLNLPLAGRDTDLKRKRVFSLLIFILLVWLTNKV